MESKKISQEDILINIYFMLMDATDIIIREVQKMSIGKSLNRDIKMYHNRMIQNMKNLKTNYEIYYQKTQEDAYKGNYARMDDLRKSANYMIRLALLISDRSYVDESIDDKIEDMIKEFKCNGFIEQETINKFTLK